MTTYQQAQYGCRENRPAIEVNQRWVGYNKEGQVFRRVRILAKHPDGGWIIKDEPAIIKRDNYALLTVCPEFNLRLVFEIERST